MNIIQDGVLTNEFKIFLCPACNCKFEAYFKNKEVVAILTHTPYGVAREYQTYCPQCGCVCGSANLEK